MKMLFKISIICILANVLPLQMIQKASAQEVSVNFQVFYDELSPYGEWIDNPTYGYVWVPNAGPDFYPYVTKWLLGLY